VDLGVKNIAVDNTGTTFSNEKVEAVRKRVYKHRASLQSKGTKSAKRRLKKVSRKESRFRTDTNHCVSKYLVEKAKDTNCAIALEDLSGINSRATVRKSQRSERLSWAFYQLRSFITYKGESGVPDGVHEHNALGTIYYEDHGNLRGFIHEIPHQINDDVTIGKGATYLQDLGAAAIKGGDIYHTFGTIEFSAHEITEKAVKEYLFSKSSNEGGLPKTETFQSYLQKKRNAMMALYEACGPFAEHIDRFPDMSYQIINDIPSLQYAIHEGVKMVSEDKYPEDKIKDRALYLQNYMDILMDEGGLNLEDAKEYLASSF
jgi:IS605 OrfB family transposase